MMIRSLQDPEFANLARRQCGAALIVTMVILVALALLGMSLLDEVMRDQQISGYQAQSRLAFHAAEAGLAEAQSQMDGATTPSISNTTLGDTYVYPHGQPSFQADPNIADPIEDMGAMAAQGMNLRIGGGGPRYQVQYWKFNVQGTAPGGTISRVEMVAGVLKGQ